jgi:hypothetical protein
MEQVLLMTATLRAAVLNRVEDAVRACGRGLLDVHGQADVCAVGRIFVQCPDYFDLQDPFSFQVAPKRTKCNGNLQTKWSAAVPAAAASNGRGVIRNIRPATTKGMLRLGQPRSF